MNPWIAEMYGTNGAGTVEKTADEGTMKLANAELFAKLAAENGVDLSKMAAEDIGRLYAEVFPAEAAKLAEEAAAEEKKEEKAEEKAEEKKEPPPFAKKEEEEKKAAAAAYVAEKQALQEKIAEADMMGRIMAHAFHQERQAIEKKAAEDAAKSAPETKTAEAAPAPSPKESFEELAALNAIKLASQAGWNAEEAQQRISAVHVLGLQESEKVASVKSADDALHVRSLEYLQQAGYPVDWTQIFGK